jgi:hypothetical protein
MNTQSVAASVQKPTEWLTEERYAQLHTVHHKPLTWERVNELWLLACNDRTKLPTHVVFARLVEAEHNILS